MTYADLSGRTQTGRRGGRRTRGRPTEWVETREVTAESGTTYQLEPQVFWDTQPGRAVRVIVSVDAGGLSAFQPVTDSFILAPDSSFAGE